MDILRFQPACHVLPFPFAEAAGRMGPCDARVEERRMELVIPDGARVHIIIIGGPLLALPNEVARPLPEPARAWGQPVLRAVLAVSLIVGGFEAGRFVPRQPAAVPGAQAAAQAPAPSPGDVPSGFREQLSQPPQVAAPPGQAKPPAGAPASPNPFGLRG